MKRPSAALIPLVLAIFCSSAAGAEVRTGWWRGRWVTYDVVDGRAIRQGDMVLGRIEDIATAPPVPKQPKTGKAAAFVRFPEYLWPNGRVPYTIASTVPAKLRQQIMSAIQVYTDQTPVRFVPRTNEPDYVRFRDEPATSNECGSSFVGMQGGAQDLDLNVDASLCDTGAAVHEMGHALGFEHEQTRGNRDYYVRVRYENIDKNAWREYDRDPGGVLDLLPYEYGSIMHYGAFDFQRNNFNTIDTAPLGIPISQRSSLSAGDIEAVRTMYGRPSATTTIATNPPGLQVVIDGVPLRTPQTFDWASGTRHTLDVPGGPQSSRSSLRYVFGRWSNDGPRSQTIEAGPANRVLTANFTTQYRVQATVGTGGGGTVSVSPPSADGFYTFGTVLTIAAAPAAGFGFLRWNASAVTSILTADSANPAVFTLNNLDIHYIADFTRAPMTTLASNIPAVTAAVDGQTVYLPVNLARAPGSAHTVAIEDRIQPAGTTGLPYRYVFQNWSNGGGATQTLTAGAASTTITAVWKRQFLVSAHVYYPDPTGSQGGSVVLTPRSPDCGNPGPDDCYYDEGAVVQVTATPRGAYAFAGWDGDLTGVADNGIMKVDDQKVVTASFQIPGRLNPAGITNAASYVVDHLAPGEVIGIFGLRLGPAAPAGMQVNNGRVSTALAETRVLFDGVPAPLVSVSSNLIGAIVPYRTAGQTHTVIQVEFQGRAGNAVTFPLSAAAPALFTMASSGLGQASIVNQNGSVNSADNPAVPGSTVLLFGTGEGTTSPAGTDGQIATTIFPRPVLPVQVTIGGRAAEVQYAGSAPGNVAGVFEILVTVPPDCPSGAVPIAVSVGGFTSPEVATIAVQ
ncbi:MAG TPA: M12 family metallopeptidase [Bryobacteraceae bacterium]|nr:M12 family metallopeptidase [Bryobacteraceae bacterium]